MQFFNKRTIVYLSLIATCFIAGKILSTFPKEELNTGSTRVYALYGFIGIIIIFLWLMRFYYAFVKGVTFTNLHVKRTLGIVLFSFAATGVILAIMLSILKLKHEI